MSLRALRNRDLRTLRILLSEGRSRRGFTLLEVLIAVMIVIIGLVGIIAMQIVAIQANATARETTEATNIAEHIITRLQQDASHWTDTNDLSSTSYLDGAITNAGVWQPFDANGEEYSIIGVPESALINEEKGRAQFCITYAADWAVQDEVIAGYVRVFWAQEKGKNAFETCGTENTAWALDDLDIASTAVGAHMVTLPFTVRRTHVEN